MPRLPNLYLIGTQKGGSTSLYHHLSKHPDIATFHHDEINLFMDGVDVYQRLEELGPPEGGGTYLVDGSRNYSRYPRHAGVPKRILDHVGSEVPRFIYALRNPVDRLISHYHWNAQRYGEHRDLLDAAESDELYVATGLYDLQLAQYLEYFPIESFTFVKFEDFRTEPQREVDHVLERLGLSPIPVDHEVRLARTNAATTRQPRFPKLYGAVTGNRTLKRMIQRAVPDRALRRIHRGLSEEVERRPVDGDVRKELLEKYFLRSIENTERLLGLDLSDWKQA